MKLVSAILDIITWLRHSPAWKMGRRRHYEELPEELPPILRTGSDKLPRKRVQADQGLETQATEAKRAKNECEPGLESETAGSGGKMGSTDCDWCAPQVAVCIRMLEQASQLNTESSDTMRRMCQQTMQNEREKVEKIESEARLAKLWGIYPCSPFCPNVCLGENKDPSKACHAYKLANTTRFGYEQLTHWSRPRLIDDPDRRMLADPMASKDNENLKDGNWLWSSLKSRDREEQIIKQADKTYIAKGVKTIANLTNLLYNCVKDLAEVRESPQLSHAVELQLDFMRKAMRMLGEKLAEKPDSHQNHQQAIQDLQDLQLEPMMRQFIQKEFDIKVPRVTGGQSDQVAWKTVRGWQMPVRQKETQSPEPEMEISNQKKGMTPEEVNELKYEKMEQHQIEIEVLMKFDDIIEEAKPTTTIEHTSLLEPRATVQNVKEMREVIEQRQAQGKIIQPAEIASLFNQSKGVETKQDSDLAQPEENHHSASVDECGGREISSDSDTMANPKLGNTAEFDITTADGEWIQVRHVEGRYLITYKSQRSKETFKQILRKGLEDCKQPGSNKVKEYAERKQMVNEALDYQNQRIKQALIHHNDDQLCQEVFNWYRIKPDRETIGSLQESIAEETELLRQQAWQVQNTTLDLAVNKAKSQFMEEKVKKEWAKQDLAMRKWDTQNNKYLKDLAQKLGFEPKSVLCTAQCEREMKPPVTKGGTTIFLYKCAQTIHDHNNRNIDPIHVKHWHIRPSEVNLKAQWELIQTHVQNQDAKLETGEHPEQDKEKVQKIYEMYKQNIGKESEHKYKSFWRKAITGNSIDLQKGEFKETKHLENELEPLLRKFVLSQFANVIFNHTRMTIPKDHKSWQQRDELEFGDIVDRTDIIISNIAEVVGWPEDQLTLAAKILTKQAVMKELEGLKNCDYCTDKWPCTPHVLIRQHLDVIANMRAQWEDQDRLLGKTIPGRRFDKEFHQTLDRAINDLLGKYKTCRVKHQAHSEMMEALPEWHQNRYNFNTDSLKKQTICSYYGCVLQKQQKSELMYTTSKDPCKKNRVVGIKNKNWNCPEKHTLPYHIRYFNEGKPRKLEKQTNLVIGVNKDNKLTYSSNVKPTFYPTVRGKKDNPREYTEKLTNSALTELTKPNAERYDTRIGGQWKINQHEGLHNSKVANELTQINYPFKIQTNTEKLMELGHRENKNKRINKNGYLYSCSSDTD